MWIVLYQDVCFSFHKIEDSLQVLASNFQAASFEDQFSSEQEYAFDLEQTFTPFPLLPKELPTSNLAVCPEQRILYTAHPFRAKKGPVSNPTICRRGSILIILERLAIPQLAWTQIRIHHEVLTPTVPALPQKRSACM
tara:strand:- start:2876 stop:3289 length:414 start_codon:yes stop_codon:yes gene_type:complete